MSPTLMAISSLAVSSFALLVLPLQRPDLPADCGRQLDICSAEQQKSKAALNQMQQANTTCMAQLRKAEMDLQACNRDRLLPEQRRALQEDISALQIEKSTLLSDRGILQRDVATFRMERSTLLTNIDELRGLRGLFD